MATKWSELSEEERRAKFEDWVEKRESKQVQNRAKNKARTAIVNKYKPEYDELVKAETKNAKVEQPDEAKIKTIVQAYVEKKVKSKARQQARKKLLDAHKDEYKKELAKAEKAPAPAA